MIESLLAGDLEPDLILDFSRHVIQVALNRIRRISSIY